MSKYTEKDAAKDTGVSIKEVEKTWHQARDDAQKSGELIERGINKAKKTTKKIVIDLSGQILTASFGEKVIYEFRCVAGDAKHPTPKGKFKKIKKIPVYRSKTYNAQMNYAMKITESGIFIHESYNYIEDPAKQNPFATIVSDTAATTMSRMRGWFPKVGELEVPVGNINLTGSHGCIRLAHTDAVKLFDWTEENIPVEVK